MSETESWQVSDAAAVVYEEKFVPALFLSWAPVVADGASVRAGDHVLDVACGTGVLTRELSKRVGPGGAVTGLDLNEGMLAVARRLLPEADWRQGDAAALPFEDDSFDVVVSQFALMYFGDPVGALKEMWRVLAPGGRLAVATWAGFEKAEGYRLLADIAEARTTAEAAKVLRSPFVIGNPDQLLVLYQDAGIENPQLQSLEGFARFPSTAEFVETEIKGSPLNDVLDDRAYQALLEEAEEKFAPYRNGSQEVALPIGTNLVTALKTA